MYKFKLYLISLFFLFNISAISQNAKKHYKTGQELFKLGKYKDAISQYSKAIDLDPQLIKAFFGRAEAYLKTNNKEKAAKDYENITVLSPKKKEVAAISGKLYYDLKNYKKAIALLDKATNTSKKDAASYRYKVISLIKLENYEKALKESNILIELKPNAENYYNLAWIYHKLDDNVNAEKKYLEAIVLMPSYLRAYIQLAYVRLFQNKLDAALEAANKAVKINTKNKSAYLVRSIIYKKKLDYPSAINDLSKLTLLYPNDIDGYFYRGIAYQNFNQHQNAINDFTKVLQIDKSHAKSYAKRAKSYEQINDYNNAVKDYERLCSLNVNNKDSKKLLENAQKRLYELNKEEKAPIFVILEPKCKVANTIEVAGIAKELKIKLKVEDESPISKLIIEGKNINFDKNVIKTGFYTTVDIEGKKEINIVAEDTYNNRGIFVYSLKRTETNKPKIKILSPIASDNGEIYLDSKDPILYIEGVIKDESLIKSITIGSVIASYKPDAYNPKFYATVDITNQNKINITVTDINDNVSIKEYKFNRSGIELLADNPMGKTWVVFIENSDYSSFTSLKGPSKDVRLMKTALAKYKIHNIIHKKNLSKRKMERFFAIELRDLVKSNRVNSILVWYAGHGKFINSTGYWIPTNAKRDDEFSYYNINSLKASMQSYSKNITHTLIITDACESGPSFYNAMRSIPKDKDCGDENATRFKSSQVFTSAGYELANDNSQFTKTFANSLNYNSNSCIPIEKVVRKVSAAVQKNSKQRPIFGKISGFADENGTFFFIKK